MSIRGPHSLGSVVGDEDSSTSERSPLLGRRNPMPPSASINDSLPTSGSLIPSIMDENEVFVSSNTSGSSEVQRRKQVAASTLGRRQSKNDDYNDFVDDTELGDQWLEVSHRNEHKREDHGTTDMQTLIHMLKGNIGTGLLALPLAMKNAGVVLGAVCLLIMGIIATHCMLQLVEASHHLCKKRQVQALNYAEVAQFAVAEHTRRPRYSKLAFYVINFFLILTQFGFCSVYFVFMGEHLHQVMCKAFGIEFGQNAWIAIVLPIVIFLCWIRNLDTLTPLSMVANVAIIFSLGVIVYEEFYQFLVHEPPDPNEIAWLRDGDIAYFAYSSLPLFFGGVIYAFEGIGMVLPLENKMKNPHHGKRVVITAMTVITILYIAFGVLGYLTYGDNLEGSITLNLNSTRVGACALFLIVKLYYAFAIYASFALQFYVPMDFIEPPLHKKLAMDKLMYWFPQHHAKIALLIQLSIRTTFVIITAALAMAIPDLDDLISLVGAFASGALALIFPPLIDILTFWREKDRRWLFIFPRPVWVIKDILIMLLGILGFIFGTYASIDQIIKNFGKDDSAGDSCGLGNCIYTLQ